MKVMFCRRKRGRTFFFTCFAIFCSNAFSQNSPPPASSSRIDAQTFQRIVNENLELRKEQTRLETEAGMLRQKNAALLVDIQDLERRKNQFALLMSQLKTPEESKEEIARLQSEKQALLREIERVRRMMADMAPPPSTTSSAPRPGEGSDLFKKIEKENFDLRLDLSKLRESLQKETGAKDLLARSEVSLKAEIIRLSQQKQTLSAELDGAQHREAGLRKSLEEQAKKAFKADKAAAGIKEQLEMQKRKEAAALLPPKGASTENSKQVGLTELSAEDLMGVARRSLAEKKAGDAEDAYLKALKLDPKNPQISYNLGVLYGDYLNDPRKAAKFYRQYLKLSPRAADAPTVRAWIIELDARL